ncbi:MAG: cobyrinate a,c-diamide synthase [Desulfobacterales bacterium]|jgi:cobyrinic acid a,c-diamide synthase|nr:cobyrinic acid a,c-diamide synthase [Desulfobacter sp.]MDP6683263.1 cobyrinate a,c-diamide synthase [Desulfobacterales bacterium]MDP6808616.1 cobyrinate a,c-diamide synthase [Desulfobacterales bacterium]|tara:strand:- start:11067 stop:12527 length:1461 start_codon:yes stop_codon:yes gene_type:complete
MTRTIPRILIAGAQSSSGKTTLTLGLVSALRRRGLKVQAFKVGPDYLDPTWLAAASGRPCYNLDGWMAVRDFVERLFSRVTRDADLAIIEGVMGLFDGAQSSGMAGSSAEIAQWLQASVVLVVNVRGMGRSIAPIVAGFADFEEGVLICGVIANHCGSERHRAILTEALASSGQPMLVGAIPRMGIPELRSRHLGLVTADLAQNCSPAVMEEFAIATERYLDLDEVLRIAHAAPPFRPLSPFPAHRGTSPDHSICLAVARDEAFHFYYQDLFDELDRRGCRIAFFSPLRESSLPQDIDALYLGGGYPEEFAEILAANEGMIDSLRRFARSGRPVYAECGGLIYLSQAVTTREAKRYPLLGILPSETRMLDHRKRLGYVEVTLKADTLWGKAGDRLRGHEFHYGELLSDPTKQDGWTAVYGRRLQNGVREAPEGFYQRNSRILASFVHLHLASCATALERFVDMCVRIRSEGSLHTAKKPIEGHNIP